MAASSDNRHPDPALHPDTQVVVAGRDPQAYGGTVNPPVYHASTILSHTVEELEQRGRWKNEDAQEMFYGRKGTPTSWALENAVAALEGGYRSMAFSSGLAAIAGALTAFLKAGDHLLMTDSAYGPTREFCDGFLRRFGVETTYYDPLIGSGIRNLLRPNTTVVFTETPGSQTFEVQDIPAIAEATHRHGARLLLDNTWATPLLFRSFVHGVDVSIHAGTKYIVGHSDAMLGLVVTNEECWGPLRQNGWEWGQCSGPDDLYLAQRGLRTMAVRLRQHEQNALEVARWLQQRPEVRQVLYPALPQDPGHALWKRDFLGASGLFGVELNPVSDSAVRAMLNGMKLFHMGFSWGGYESLVIPTNPRKMRTASPWRFEGPLLRLHIGLEHPADLMADLEAGFVRLKSAQSL
jgi:cystathionine beta-lyase